ncbi:similar to Saccharomyces cerevisiae YIL116W HIS5 Histidinol-phosphate aminotransferase, catalyzes the seventh step in histidine biosynthesis [Maudiozyma barnettii]|uniref:histidinol-phosphate transaminase n=1 Tax=Maudiozyma barnettii TaxID=61262 RepID=A0A8H2VCR0_9SACH|nr:histidinol-phosphate transaminase [Kazachstania barnettii]CAB4252876.1 similar to Saccharomyces cerevisiae YIL116W HIS5 Histidinol-phosphate aminotransferase, catalyzes the seventh step in histidine biosynthesis [Kazachstania barnettii]CAD1780671.1 similar to Saccharomyces cerevisiae YIL116W HIS5 Histidinol-phosphate aminotransferase, catalyzes the seventh step in histidine biosynthesis [Kazachstania barnettii]
MTFDLQKIVRPKIYNLEPYRCARDDFTDGILLDANENAHGPTPKELQKDSQLHRYPDPHQLEFKEAMAQYRNKTSAFKDDTDLKPLNAENLCLGVGSDESIDAIIRATCVPAKEKILVLPPTYSMYSVCANINDIEVVQCPLIVDDNSFQVDTERVLAILKADPLIKLCFITSPGNPTGVKIDTDKIIKILTNWDTGLVVVDEAYIDFCGGSTAPLVTKYPNLVTLQTLSKSFGLAGIRLGMTFASSDLSRILNAMKAPYNISRMAASYALTAVQHNNLQLMEQTTEQMNIEQRRLLKELTALNGVDDQYVGGLDANFILLRINGGDNTMAKQLYYNLATISGVVVRFRGTELGCTGCLRVTVGTEEENNRLITEFKKTLAQLMESK